MENGRAEIPFGAEPMLICLEPKEEPALERARHHVRFPWKEGTWTLWMREIEAEARTQSTAHSAAPRIKLAGLACYHAADIPACPSEGHLTDRCHDLVLYQMFIAAGWEYHQNSIREEFGIYRCSHLKFIAEVDIQASSLKAVQKNLLRALIAEAINAGETPVPSRKYPMKNLWKKHKKMRRKTAWSGNYIGSELWPSTWITILPS
jgi:hypothetical protein